MNISEIESVINRDFMPQEIETIFRLYPMLFQIENIDYINLILDKFGLELILSQNKQMVIVLCFLIWIIKWISTHYLKE